MSKYRIEEVRETLNSGEVRSVFYIFQPFLFFLRKYYRRYVGYGTWVKWECNNIECALKKIKKLEKDDNEISAEKTKKKEIIIHKI